MTKNFKFLVLFFSAMLCFSCKDTPEKIPAYLKISPFKINATGGADWHKLPFVWVYVGTEFLGAYSPDKEFPILAEGTQTVTIFPGVNENGIVETPVIYPFLESYTTEVVMVPGQTTVIEPETKYLSSTVFAWGTQSDFDLTTLAFENLDADNTLNLAFDSQDAFAGRSALMQVDTSHQVMDVATEWVTGLPTTGGREVWLEMHYKCDANLELGLRGTGNANFGDTNQPIYYFQPKDTWNKIYINLTPFVAQSMQTQYSLHFKLLLPYDSSGKLLQKTAKARFDNLRLLYF